jgi:hypothetical protein
MLLKFLSDCRADGRSFMMGEVADVGQGVANELIALGRAEIAPDPKMEPEIVKPASRRSNESGVVIETASAEELAMPPGKVPTKRGRPQLQKED